MAVVKLSVPATFFQASSQKDGPPSPQHKQRRASTTRAIIDKITDKSAAWPLYKANWVVACLHGLQCFVMIILTGTTFDAKRQGIPYVSAVQTLTVTNHAMTRKGTEPTCSDVLNSPMYNQPNKTFLPSDLMPTSLYDFGDTFPVQFNTPGVKTNTAALICTFFALSFGFQLYNGHYLSSNPNSPRIIHYLEYSLSSSLMIVVMAVNVGVFELNQLIALFGLYFGMNLFGACAELLCCAHEETANPPAWLRKSWYVPHFAGWVVFLLAYVPLLVKYATTCQCSTPEPPWFMTLAVAVETVCFCLFGYIQWSFLVERTPTNPVATADRTDILLRMDFCNIALSFFAKTTLAWLLMGPAASMKDDV